jgi:hypothetical protein
LFHFETALGVRGFNLKHADNNELKVSTRVMMLKPGMHIFRYASRLPDNTRVLLTLQPAPLGKGSIDFFPGEGVSRNTLGRFGDCMVVRVKGDFAGVLVAEYHLENAGAAAPSVDLRVDYIDTSENFLQKGDRKTESPTWPEPPPRAPASPLPASDPWPASPFAVPAPTATTESLELLGHIERRGDVRVTDDWLGDPTGSARLEGFAIAWKNRPQDVDLAYTCRIEGIGQTPAIFSGGYAGTRQRAVPITGLSLALAGPKSTDFELSGQVVFAGCSPRAITPGQALSGPQGSEPLVALRVCITRQGGETAVPRSLSASPWDDPRITQIFRANR